jgi:uncharacterized protein YbjQ (UPF0145 family)
MTQRGYVTDVSRRAPAALAAFTTDPGDDTFRALASGLWTEVEANGGATSIAVKEELHGLALQHGLDDVRARSIIDRVVPGPMEYAGGRAPLTSEDLTTVGPRLPLATTWNLPGWEITATLGVAAGNTVRTRNTIARVATGLQATFGGELGMYTMLLTEARDEALGRLSDAGRALGGDAVVGVTLSTSTVFDVAVEVLAVGTAVTCRPEPAPTLEAR